MLEVEVETRLLLLDSNKDLVYNNSDKHQLDNISNKQLDEYIEENQD